MNGKRRATLAEKFQSLKKEKLAYVPEDYDFFMDFFSIHFAAELRSFTLLPEFRLLYVHRFSP